MVDDKTSQIDDLFSEVDSFLEQKKVKESTSFKDDLLLNAKDKWTDARTNNIVKSVALEFAQFESETKEETTQIKEEKTENTEAISELEKMIETTSLKGLMEALKDKEVPTDKEVEEKLASTRELNVISENKEPEIKEEIISIDPEIEKLKEESLPEELDANKEITIFNNEPEVTESFEEAEEEKTSDFVNMFIDDVYEDNETLDDLIEEIENEAVSVESETVEEPTYVEEAPADTVEVITEEQIVEEPSEEKLEKTVVEPETGKEAETVEVAEPEPVEEKKEEVITELEKPRPDDDFIVVPRFIENKKSVEEVIEENISELNKEEPVKKEEIIEEKPVEIKEEVKEEKKEKPQKKVPQKKSVHKKKHKKEPEKGISLWVFVMILVALTALIVGIVVVQFVQARSQAALLNVYMNEVMILEDKIRYLL